LLWHVIPDPLPSLLLTIVQIKPVNAAVILMIPTPGIGGMDDGIVGIVTKLVLGPIFFRRRKVHGHATIHGPPRTAPIVRKTQAPSRETENHAVGVEGIHLHRVTLRTVWSTRCKVVAPLRENGAVVETGHAVPGHSVVFALE